MALVRKRVENGMGENRREQLWHWLGREERMKWERTGENNCDTGWGENREWNGREQGRTTVALVGRE